ncbi:MAG: TATA-box-binding protein [Promethearchaeota archaeon]
MSTPPNLPNRVTLRIENIVASVNFHCHLPLETLLEKYKDIEKKENFPGLIVKMKKPKATILIFSSGKMVCTGIRLTKYVPIVVEKVTHKIQNAGIEITQKPDIKVENIVVRGDFHSPINLDIASLALNRAIYEPEVFPGLIYKLTVPNKVCFLIFSSGRIICTGAHDNDVIKTEVKNLAKELKKHKVLGKQSQEIEKIDLDLSDLV